jgi:hypothetical protein
MAETIREAELSDQIDTLTRLATVVLNEHTNADGLCAVCGCAFPCDRCSQPREGSSTVRLTSLCQKCPRMASSFRSVASLVALLEMLSNFLVSASFRLYAP